MTGQDASITKRLAAELLAGTIIGLLLFGPALAEGPSIRSLGSAAGINLPDGIEAPNDLLKLLPLLLTSDERKQFAERLEASIRKGDLNGAENSLNTAIEVGTLAIILADNVRNPSLLAALDALGIKGDSASQPFPDQPEQAAADACSAAAPQDTTNAADLQQALDQEQAYSSMLSKTLTDLMQEYNAAKAQLETESASQAAKTFEMQDALQREKGRSESALRELTGLQNEYRMLQETRGSGTPPASSNSAELEARLRQEQEKSDNAVRQLAGMEKELHTLQASKDEAMASTSERVSQLQRALAEAQIQNGILSDEVTTVHEELRTLREPNQPSPVPLMLRIQKTGVEAPLPQAQKSDEPQETSSVPAEAKIASVAGGPVPQDAVSAPPRSEPPPVVVGSLPESVQPLPVASKPADPAKAPADAAGKTSPPAENAKPDDRLMSRAEELFHKGDVSGARLLLQRSLENGNARAAFLMAETFDPNVLSKLRVLGIRGDVAKAQEFYAQALALGIPEAGTRMQALK